MKYNPTETRLEDGAYIVVTHQCNRRCLFCSDKYRNTPNNKLLPDTLIKLVPSLLERGVKRVTIVGGEPFQSPYIEDILKILHQHFEVVISTNSDYPEIMKKVSDYVDHWNFSMYGDKEPPFLPGELRGDITISTLIHAEMLFTKQLLDEYIDKYQDLGFALKFSTLSNANLWCEKNKEVPYLDALSPITQAFNGVVSGHWYRDCFIDRKDIPPKYFIQPRQSLKVKTNGAMDFSWIEN